MQILPASSKMIQFRAYKSERARKIAIAQLVRHGKYNYIVTYTDLGRPALNIGNAGWVKQGQVYVD